MIKTVLLILLQVLSLEDYLTVSCHSPTHLDYPSKQDSKPVSYYNYLLYSPATLIYDFLLVGTRTRLKVNGVKNGASGNPLSNPLSTLSTSQVIISKASLRFLRIWEVPGCCKCYYQPLFFLPIPIVSPPPWCTSLQVLFEELIANIWDILMDMHV
jgi:hypothetical protein